MLSWACVGVVAVGEASGSTGPNAVTLAWDRNPEPDVVGYRLHYGVESGVYPTAVDVGDVVTATLSLPGAGTYHVVATAYNSAGLESLPSSEIVVSVSDPDGVAPMFVTFPGDIVVLPDSVGGTTAGVFWDEPTVDESAGVVSLTSNHSSGDQFSAGTTTVTYTAVNGAGNVMIESFRVTVGGIDIWRSQTFGAEAGNPLVAGDFANTDGDRWVNLGEYALGHDVTRHDGEEAFSQVLANGQHVLVFRHNPYLADVEFRVEGCDAVDGEWSPVATLSPGGGWVYDAEQLDVSSHREGERQEVTIILPLGETRAAYFRLVVSLVGGGGGA